MPLYEGIGSTISDKLIVVIDIGAAYTKFGFSGEFSPRCIIRSEVTVDKKVRRIMDYKDAQDLYDMLVDFLHTLYFKYALFSPKDRSVVIVESLLAPTIFRETLAKVLFMYYEISSLLILPSHLVSLCPLAIETGLVLDVGYNEAVVIPICSGIPILHAWEALPLAAKVVHEKIKEALEKCNIGVNLDEEVVEDVKVRCCFVTTMKRAQLFATYSKDIQPCPNVEYPLDCSKKITVPGTVRETSFDVLFEEDNDHLSLPSMILDAILKCPIDLRKSLAENILVVGGTAMMPGFKARLKDELYDRLNSERYQNKLHIKTFKFHSAPAKDNYTAWLGGAIYGSADFISMKSLTRDTYFKEKRVPDWANMLDNQIRNA